MNVRKALRRYWPETLLVLAVTFPWLSLLALGGVWLWQQGHTWAWAIAAATSGLLAWALFWLVRRRRTAREQEAPEPLGEYLGETAEPSPDWGAREREIWPHVVALSNVTPPFSFTDIEPVIASARQTATTVARHFHPEQTETLTEFTLPEVLLLTERVSRRLRGIALQFDPVRASDEDRPGAVGVADDRTLRPARAGRLPALACGPGRVRPCDGAAAGNQRPDRRQDGDGGIRPGARLADSDLRAGGRPRRHRSLFRTTFALARRNFARRQPTIARPTGPLDARCGSSSQARSTPASRAWSTRSRAKCDARPDRSRPRPAPPNTCWRSTAGRRLRSSTRRESPRTQHAEVLTQADRADLSSGWHRRRSRRAARTAVALTNSAPGQAAQLQRTTAERHRGADAHR